MPPGSLSLYAAKHPAAADPVISVFFLLFNYFQMVECVKIYRINDREGKRFGRLTEANRPLVGMIASIRARQQPCSASTWCTQPTAWAQQATAPTASPGKKTNTPLLQRSKIKWAATIQSRHEKWITWGCMEEKKRGWNGGHRKGTSLGRDTFLNGSKF